MTNATAFMPRPRRIPTTSSFSQLWMFGVCPRKWAYRYLNRERDPISEQAKFGQGVDAAFERLYREARNGPVPSPDDLIATFAVAAPDQIHRAAHVRELFRLYDKDGHLLARDPESALTQAHVSLLLLPVTTRIRGYIDLLHHGQKSQKSQKPAIVADLKCPKSVPSQLRADRSIQLTLYSVAAGARTAELIGFTIRKPQSKKFEAAIIPLKTDITPERIEQHALYLNGLETSLKNCIATHNWPRREPDGLCAQCSFQRQCWSERVPIRKVNNDGTIEGT